MNHAPRCFFDPLILSGLTFDIHKDAPIAMHVIPGTHLHLNTGGLKNVKIYHGCQMTLNVLLMLTSNQLVTDFKQMRFTCTPASLLVVILSACQVSTEHFLQVHRRFKCCRLKKY